MASTQQNLKLYVKRTFLCVKDDDSEECNVNSSKSDNTSDVSNSNDTWFGSISSFATTHPPSVFSNVSPSPQRQQGRFSSSMEVGPPKEEQLVDLHGDKTLTRQKIEDKDGPIDPLWSLGSKLHGSGQCTPCAWLFKPRGCSLAGACTFCHTCPETEIKIRRKAKDAQLRQQRIEGEMLQDMNSSTSAARNRVSLKMSL